MTRVNLVSPFDLCDQHLLAEHREITRIPNTILSGKAKVQNIPDRFCLGPGHVKFFYNKLRWLQYRYNDVHHVCLLRGFQVQYKFPDSLPDELFNSWEPDAEDIELSRQRINERLSNMTPRYTRFKG